MRVLVTGGAGFIGSHLVHLLHSHKLEVLVLDDLSRGLAKNVPPEVKLEKTSIGSQRASDLIAQWRPNVVVHLAAQANVTVSLQDPLVDADANVLGTLRLLNAASFAGTQVFISASSGGAIYGDAATYPTPETATVQPQSPYGASKYCAEIYSDLFARSTSMRCVSLRFSNVFGPRQSDRSESGVVSIFAKRMIEGKPIVVNGDGRQSRDFIYVADVAQALYATVLTSELKGSYNIGSGAETTLLGLIANLREIVGGGGAVKFQQAIFGEVRRSCLDASLFTIKSGWVPQYSFQKGLRLTIGHLREHLTEKTSFERKSAPRASKIGHAGPSNATSHTQSNNSPP